MNAESTPPVEVAAALVFRDGRLLVTQRPAGGHLAGLWEFPGGKREPGETFEQCLARELQEELGIEVRILEFFARVEHEYPGKRVDLRFYLCRWLRHEPQAIGCAAFRWVTAAEVGGLEFPEADAQVLDRLKSSPGLWGPS
ncbi:MAG: 8-oxo-dGTP diphosphatase MutT [Verrucomicrobiota bacterium]